MLAAHSLDRLVPVPPGFAPTCKASFPPIGLSCPGLILSSRVSLIRLVLNWFKISLYLKGFGVL